jgi:cellulose synthase/poly-beta-1,6-N-acetylglucosamine synthase-like glycosyltransferase
MSTSAVASLVKCFEQHPDIEAVAGNVFINCTDEKRSMLKSFQEIEYCIEQEVTRYLQSVEGNVLVCPGPLFAIKRQVTETTRFSDITVVEDADFTIQILSKYKKIIREPKAEVYTRAPKSLGNWFNQRKRWWYGNLQLWRVNKRWAKGNPWMILTYLSYPASILSIMLMSLLPFLVLSYDNANLILLRGILWIIIPLILFIVFTLPLFIKRSRKLIPALVPYYMIYGTMKTVILGYLYIRYLLGIGVKVRFGSRTLRVK